MAIVNDDAGRALQGWILFWLGIAIVVVLLAAWLVRGVEPNTLFMGVAMMMVGYGDKLRRNP